MKRTRRRSKALFAIRLGMAALLAIRCARPDAQPAAKSAPSFVAQDLDGKPVSLSSLRGKVVVLNEWATWCEPCRGEIPQLEALHRRYSAQGLVLVGVDVDAFGTAADVRDFVRDHEMTYAIWLDPDKKFALQFGTFGVPETFVVDRRGMIRYRQIGAIRDGDSTVAAKVREALASTN